MKADLLFDLLNFFNEGLNKSREEKFNQKLEIKVRLKVYKK